jgi:putative nucleotidyltransferase with HDIG domain
MASTTTSGFERITVPLSALQPGWVVDRDIYFGSVPLLAAGVSITTEILSNLRRRNIGVVEVRRDSALAFAAQPLHSDKLTALLSRARDLHEIHGVRQAIPEPELEQATDQIASFFEEIEKGQAVDLTEMRETVASLVDQFLTRTDLAVKLLDLDRFDRYTYRHSINVGLLFMVVARDWGTYDELIEAVFGAILHDMGKAKVGSAIINKEGPLDDAEWVVMKRHPVWSAEMLVEAGALPSAISVVRWHHERLDGTGYPDGLSAGQIDRHARLAAICDVYDALTTRRSYKQKMDFARAIGIIIRGCGKHFDTDVAHQFIRRIGRYPVGTFVRLSSGEVAVVLRVNEHAISRPVVSRVTDAAGNERTLGEVLDLSQDSEHHIVEILVSPGSALE